MSKKGGEVFCFALYDWGNSAFTTLVVTFLYSFYFTHYAVSDPVRGTELWSRAITVSALSVAFLSPLLGAAADRRRQRKAFLLAATLICIVFSSWLTFLSPSQVIVILVVFTLANIAFEMGMVFYNSFLPLVASPDRIGRVSGFAWGMGYAGGLCSLGLAFLLFRPENSWLGISMAEPMNFRCSGLLSAVWYLVFALPFLWVARENSTAGGPGQEPASECRRLRACFHLLRCYPQTGRFLLARLIFNDGLVTIFAFGGIYAGETFGMGFEEIILFAVVLNLAAGAGAFAFGFLDDRVGSRNTVLLSLAALSLASALAAVARSAAWFWLAAVTIGVFAGPNQSASRSLMGRFTPPHKQAEFFGLFAFSGKASSFLGPLVLGLVTGATGSQRWGVSTVIIFFLLGGLLLFAVNEKEGEKTARLEEV